MLNKKNDNWFEKNEKLTIVVIITLFIILFEIFLRWTFVPIPKRYHFEKNVFEVDQHLRYRLTPGKNSVMSNGYFTEDVKVNERGFRDKYNNSYNDEGIYAIGDSQTFGHGIPVSDTWVEILQEKLHVNVVNTAVPAYNSEHYLQVIKNIVNEGKTVRAVIYGMTWNDVFEDGSSVPKTVADGYLISANIKSNNSIFLQAKSYLINNYSLGKLLHFFMKKILPSGYISNNDELEAMRNNADKFMGEISQLNKYLKSIRSRLIVVHINSTNHVRTDIIKNALENHSYNEYFASTIVKDYFKAEGIVYIDSTDAIRNEYVKNGMKRSSIMLPVDPHNNKGSNDIIAELLFNVLE